MTAFYHSLCKLLSSRNTGTLSKFSPMETP